LRTSRPHGRDAFSGTDYQQKGNIMTTLTRLTDSGFVLTDDTIDIVFDLGEYCDTAALAGISADAAVYSHQHSDHCACVQRVRLPCTRSALASMWTSSASAYEPTP
jgi:phosphoribosyl 1,2-cyclic phosphodiesterase